jgi:hypothetical protein
MTPEERKLRQRGYNYKHRYGITLEVRDDMLASQNFRCAICEADAPGGPGSWHIDHCHTTGHVRGLLCNHCNLMLGHARDNTRNLQRAIEYLNDRTH